MKSARHALIGLYVRSALAERSELQSNLLHPQNMGTSRPIGMALLGPTHIHTHSADALCGIWIPVRLAWGGGTVRTPIQPSRPTADGRLYIGSGNAPADVCYSE